MLTETLGRNSRKLGNPSEEQKHFFTSKKSALRWTIQVSRKVKMLVSVDISHRFRDFKHPKRRQLQTLLENRTWKATFWCWTSEVGKENKTLQREVRKRAVVSNQHTHTTFKIIDTTAMKVVRKSMWDDFFRKLDRIIWKWKIQTTNHAKSSEIFVSKRFPKVL